MRAENIRIVLVNPTHPGNIGASARAMKNMGLDRLYLVEPKLYPHPEATARASGAADDVLERAVICETLAQALEGCSLAIGASARRSRRIEWPQVDARGCGELAVRESGAGSVAIIFGREHSGLTNEELGHCNYLVHIPCNPDYTALNLAAAVQIITYEVHMAAGAAPAQPEAEPLATADGVERLYAHLEQVLIEIDFLDPANPKHLMRRLRRLFNRARLDKNELNILRGMCTAIQARRGTAKC